MLDKKTILLVEDDPLDSKRFERTLSQLRYPISVTAVRNPQEACVLLAKQQIRPFLIVLDLYTPDCDGIGFIQGVKETPALRAIPIVVLTGSEAVSDVIRCYHRGVSGYLTKLTEPAKFQQQVKTLVDYWLMSSFPNPSSLPVTLPKATSACAV